MTLVRHVNGSHRWVIYPPSEGVFILTKLSRKALILFFVFLEDQSSVVTTEAESV